MKRQISVSLDKETISALQRLSVLEHRSVSAMAALIIEQRLGRLRQEYRQQPALPSLPKAPRTSARCWNVECRELFGD